MASQHQCHTPVFILRGIVHNLQNTVQNTDQTARLSDLRRDIETDLRDKIDGPGGSFGINSQPQPALQLLGEEFGQIFFGITALGPIRFFWVHNLYQPDPGTLGETVWAPNLQRWMIKIEPYQDRAVPRSGGYNG